MPTRSRTQDITFILVRPRYPGNIGSAARALKNMGFAKLSLVSPSVLPTDPEARRLAVGAVDLLRKAKVSETIEKATRGLRFLVGTSRRTGKYRRDFVPLPELASRLPAGQKVGILFGPEERGLTNRELAHCNLVTTIPADPGYPSLNLAQAVMVVAYQLQLMMQGRRSFDAAGGDHRSSSRLTASRRLAGVLMARGDGRRRSEGPPPLASIDQVEGMYQHLEKTLTSIGFFPHKNSFHMMRTLRQLFGRTGMTEREVRIIRGICRQVLWAICAKSDGGSSGWRAGSPPD